MSMSTSTSTSTSMGSIMASNNEQRLYKSSVVLLNLLAIPTFIQTYCIVAPYGRHASPGWGPTIPSWLSWFAMESPTVFFTLIIYSFGRNALSFEAFALLSVFLIHYAHRTFIYPLRIRNITSRFPIVITLVAFSFNLLNSYVQARMMSQYENYRMLQYFWPRFCLGVVVFFVGMGINVKCDMVLVGLKNNGKGYQIPKGGVFEWVSCGNYFGEILEWFGWAIMTWSWAGFGFFIYTCSNLVPRASANHKWYLEKFGEDYPKHRKAVIPFLY